MKLASKSLPVFNQKGECVIGTLVCGDAIQEMEQTSSGLLIAYIIGLIKNEDAQALLSPEDWDCEVDNKKKFLSFIAAQEGSLYVWGAQGQQMSPLLIRKMEDGEANYKRALAHFNEHVRTGQALTAFDCSGLIVAFLLAEERIFGDTSANGLYRNECSDIDKEELTAGDLVFKKYLIKNQMYHVGVYMGDGSVVHAKGRDDGVVRESISATGWNRFGRLKCCGGVSCKPVNVRLLKNSGRPYVRGDDVLAVQRALENRGYYTGRVDGIYGANTEKAVRAFQQAAGLTVDGIVGPKTWSALMI